MLLASEDYPRFSVLDDFLMIVKFLITFFNMVGEPPVRKDTEFQYAAEILITKSELEDKNKLVFTLQQQVSLFTLSAVCLQFILTCHNSRWMKPKLKVNTNSD